MGKQVAAGLQKINKLVTVQAKKWFDGDTLKPGDLKHKKFLCLIWLH